MRMIKFIIIFIYFNSIFIIAQTNNAPFLLWECSQNKNIIIKDNRFNDKFNDTLKVRFIVSVFLKHPINDITKPIIVKSTNLDRLYLKKDNEKKFTLVNNDEKNKNNFIKELWKVTDSITNYWYKNQNYKELINRSEYDKQIPFIGQFYIVKKK